MRPTRLELEGFASFRDRTTVDFADADLFVLSGRTGAGKSSVIDAMVFGLYGTVPRYGDRRVVAPIITQGANEARVRLDFIIGEDAYTAVRVVRRTARGATTKEARLERWTSPDGSTTVTLAGTADDLTAEVERRLGLTFDHFTTCCVLPQGTFQAFLHATGKDRQDLLVNLLDLDVFRRVGAAARDRSTASRARLDGLTHRLEGEFADVTPQALQAARDRQAALADLQARLDDAQPALDATLEEGRAQAAAQDAAQQRAARLDQVVVPDGVDGLGLRLDEARESARLADEARDTLDQEVDAATAARDQAGDLAALRGQRERVAELSRLDDQRQQTSDRVDQAQQVAQAADAEVAAAEQAVVDMRAHLDQARRGDLAATLAQGLHAGDDCPVCARALDEDPTVEPVAEVADAEQALRDGEAAVNEARRRAAEAHRAHESARATLAAHDARRQELQVALESADLPVEADALDAAIAAVTQHDDRLRQLREREREARQQVRAAAAAVQEAEAAVRDAWARFDEAWQGLADLQPPAPDRADLSGSWKALAAWADERAPALRAEAVEAEQQVQATRDRYRQQVAELGGWLAEADVTTNDNETPRDACVRATAQAAARVDRLTEQLQQVDQLRQDVAAAQADQRVAAALGQHLNAKGFERWLLDRALRRLVTGATQILHDLSHGAYSLSLDDQSAFQVIDHRNADQVRSARTLSGGETFLASLALALALSDHVADLAAHGSARLDALILDEGFGTLDAETLDVVASTLEELGSRGRMVGVITHVQTLAERLPVRFHVRKEGGVSSVERHEAGDEVVA